LVPTRKVGGGIAIGIPLGIIVVWLIQTVAKMQVPAEVGAAIGSIMSFAASYLIPDKVE